MSDPLSLPESFALLLIEPGGKRAVDSGTFDTGLAGAALAELALRGSLTLAEDTVRVTDDQGTGNGALDGTRATIAASPKPRPAKWWVSTLGKKPLRDEVLTALVARGMLGEEQRKTLGLFTTTRHPERDGDAEAQLRRELADVVIGSVAPTPRQAVLVGLLDATGTLRKQFDLIDRRLVQRIIAGEGDWTSPAVKAVLQQIQAAALVAVTTAAAVAATTSIASS